MGRYRYKVYARASTPRFCVVFGLQWQVLDCVKLAPAADLGAAMAAAIDRLRGQGWQTEGSHDFGFVFIHPFMDGNGRLHRFLIHDVLSLSGFTPKGIVLPVSAVILANLNEYVHTLECFSQPLQARTIYNPDVPETPATGNDALYFRYYDATNQASFLYRALERTVEQDLDEEISYLLGFDTAHAELRVVLDWPAHSLDLFIRLVHQNGGHLSKTKRQSNFAWMTDDEVKHSEAAVVEAFKLRKVE